jgi:hypothetical protein
MINPTTYCEHGYDQRAYHCNSGGHTLRTTMVAPTNPAPESADCAVCQHKTGAHYMRQNGSFGCRHCSSASEHKPTEYHIHTYNIAGVCTTCGRDADALATDHQFCEHEVDMSACCTRERCARMTAAPETPECAGDAVEREDCPVCGETPSPEVGMVDDAYEAWLRLPPQNDYWLNDDDWKKLERAWKTGFRFAKEQSK